MNFDAHEQEMDFYLAHMGSLKEDTRIKSMIKKVKDKNNFSSGSGRNAVNF